MSHGRCMHFCLQSKLCNLNDSSPAELVKRGEHADEWGGYFIVKGRERFVRMLLNPRRNYPMVIKRSTWKNKDLHFSDVGIYIRCIAADHTAAVSDNHNLFYDIMVFLLLFICRRENLMCNSRQRCYLLFKNIFLSTKNIAKNIHACDLWRNNIGTLKWRLLKL